jgi:hypothetical protein
VLTVEAGCTLKKLGVHFFRTFLGGGGGGGVLFDGNDSIH